MGRIDYKTCKVCGRHADVVGELSHQRLCRECGEANLYENVTGLISHNGPAFRRWRFAIAASVGAVPLDDARTEPR